MEDLKIEYLDISELEVYENNTRKHTEKDVVEIEKSIKEFGFADPIGIWSDHNVIVEGHGRLQAAKNLGMTKVPVIRLDHMTDEQRRAYGIMHNKTAENSEWDFDKLQKEIEGLDLSMFELDWDFDSTDNGEIIEDEVPEVKEEEPNAKKGDIYILGNHRLMCGDSTSVTDLQKLLGGQTARMVCTDPPYNMSYQGAGNTPDSKRKSSRIMNDSMPEDKFKEFLTEVFRTMSTGMDDGASFYVFYKEMGYGTFMQALKDAGLTYKQELVWVKNQIVLGGSKYQSMYEPCLFGCNGKSVKYWYGGRKNRSVIESVDLMNEAELREAIRELAEDIDTDVIREHKQLKNDLHPTMKPVKLIAKLVGNSSKEGDVVLDLFGGSGTTMIACEQLGRKSCLMELDPKYVDVIVERWEKFTGKKAVRVNE